MSTSPAAPISPALLDLFAEDHRVLEAPRWKGRFKGTTAHARSPERDALYLEEILAAHGWPGITSVRPALSAWRIASMPSRFLAFSACA